MISPIENNGMIARTQDYSSFKLQEDTRAAGGQIYIQEQSDQNKNANVKTVHRSDDSDRPDTNHDAREEGRNKYFNNRNSGKEKKPAGDGVFIVKKSGGFDLKI